MAILKKLTISGFKSIEHADIELRPLNVLIGANGAGKSNLISLLEFLYEVGQNRLQEFVLKWGVNSLLNYGVKATARIQTRLDFEGEDSRFDWEVQFVPTPRESLIIQQEAVGSNPTSGDHRFAWGPQDRGSDLISHIAMWRSAGASQIELAAAEAGMAIVQHSNNWGIFHFADTSSTAAIRRRCYMHDNLKLHSDGSNLAAVLWRLHETKGNWYWRILETIRQVAPWFGDFSLEPIKPNETDVALNWRDRHSDSLFGPHQLPDGALRAMALITLLLPPEEDLPPLIVIDEPELGLHPAAITVVAALLRGASLRSQVIVATQSVAMLEEFDVGDVIVVDREDGRSTFTRQDPERLKEWLEEYTLGELWQKNSIGGGPF